MPLIQSISGIRGTLGGIPGQGLTPPDIVRFTSGFIRFLQERTGRKKVKIVLGRDARISGRMVRDLVSGTLTGMGADLLDIGMATTPTTEIAVVLEKADGGIVITASHNPIHWNALKLLNENGEFFSSSDGDQVLKLASMTDTSYADIQYLGKYSFNEQYLDRHIEMICSLDLVNLKAINLAKFHIVLDGVNSIGGIAVPALLKALGVKRIDTLYCDPTGEFPHNPEPLPEHLSDICSQVVVNRANLGIVVDPDVDRLAFINEIGEPIGEEYTLVAVADYVLKHKPGNTVSNLSSTQALEIITKKAGGKYFASAVGEVNVVELMKEKKAVIGGEGNGGVIYPALHYGRDALVGIALFLSHLATSGLKCSALRDQYPTYFISKNKIPLAPEMDIDKILRRLIDKYKNWPIQTIDGVRIQFEKEWVHLRRSNTEPIVRIYAESDLQTKADNLARKIISDVCEILNDHA